MWFLIIVGAIIFISFLVSSQQEAQQKAQQEANIELERKILTNFPNQIIQDVEIYSKKFGNLYEYFTSY